MLRLIPSSVYIRRGGYGGRRENSCGRGGRNRVQVLFGQVILEPTVDHRHILLVPLSLLFDDPERLLDDGVRRFKLVLVVHVEPAHHVVTLLRVEGRRGEVDDTVPKISLVLESLFHGVPVLMQEVEESPVAGCATGQHAEDQVDVRVREILVLIQHGHLQQSETEANKKRERQLPLSWASPFVWVAFFFFQLSRGIFIGTSKLNSRYLERSFVVWFLIQMTPGRALNFQMTALRFKRRASFGFIGNTTDRVRGEKNYEHLRSSALREIETFRNRKSRANYTNLSILFASFGQPAKVFRR